MAEIDAEAIGTVPTAPTTEVTAQPNGYSFVPGKERTGTLTLDWPLSAPDGAVISELTLRRLTGAEVAAVQDAIMGGDESKMLALFTDAPAELIDALDQDDRIELKKRMVDFLPRSLRAVLEAAQEEMVAAAFPTGAP